MAALIEGDFVGKAARAEFGGNKNGKPAVFVDMQVTEGPHAGKRFSFDGKMDEKSIKYTKASMIALGWKGVDVSTFAKDVMEAARVVPFEVEIATWNKDDGTTKQWSAVRSIGRTRPPLSQLEKDKIADVNQWFKEAGDVGASNGAKPGDDIPF